MILNNNSTNRVDFTLSESVTYTGSPVYFLFRLYSLTTHEEKLFTATDISNNIQRYNRFNITLTGATYENLTGGTIHIDPIGEYYLDIYQQAMPTNLSLSGVSGGIIERQLVQIKGQDLTITNISYSGTPNTYLGYNG
jgi:hypothetical protein